MSFVSPTVFVIATWLAAICSGVGIVAALVSAIVGYQLSEIASRYANIKIAEANARQSEAELKLAQLRKLAGPRSIDLDVFKKELEGKPKAPVAIWYVPEASDGYWFASRLSAALNTAGWEASRPQIIPTLTEEDVERIAPSPGRLFSMLRSDPPAMTAGGQPSGVTVVADNNNYSMDPNAPASPYRALFQALAKSTGFVMRGSGGSQFMPVPKGTLRVVVAPKDDPMFVDEPAKVPTTNSPD